VNSARSHASSAAGGPLAGPRRGRSAGHDQCGKIDIGLTAGEIGLGRLGLDALQAREPGLTPLLDRLSPALVVSVAVGKLAVLADEEKTENH